MAHLHLRYEGAYESALPTFSDTGIWDIADREPVIRLDDIEKMLGEAIKQGVSTIRPFGLPPMAVDYWVAVLLSRWNRMVLTKVLTQLFIDAHRTGRGGWYELVRKYVELKNYSLELAVETVVLRYLANGEPQVLLYLTWRNYVPSANVGKRVGEMLTRRSRIFYIGFKPKRGRRRKWKNSKSEKGNTVLDFSISAELLAVGKYPGRRFWDYLAAAFCKDLRPAVQQKWQLQEPFSVEAKLEYKKRSRENAGDREDLGLVARDIEVAQLLQERIDKEEPVKNALEDVVKDWNATASDGWRITEATLKKVYGKVTRDPKPCRPARAVSKPASAESEINWFLDEFGNRARIKKCD
jgi:hypothetical protein